MNLHVLAECFNLTLVAVYGDWGWREMAPVSCVTWPGFKREMTNMCRETHLRPEFFPVTSRPDRRGAFENQWGI